jgi:putative endonuclease
MQKTPRKTQPARDSRTQPTRDSKTQPTRDSKTQPKRGIDGAEAETLAATFLVERGLTIVERNWRRRCGELDLIARDGDTVVFVEVRLRRRADFGGAGASITAAKQARLVKTAGLYLARFSRAPACRFDAILFDALGPARIEWLRDIISA